MSTINQSGHRAFVAASAISANIRVKLNSSGEAAIASNDAVAIGFAEHDVASAGTLSVRLASAPGTYFGMADTAITRGDPVYPAANGKISGTVVSGVVIGYAFEAATADRDVIEVIPPHK